MTTTTDVIKAYQLYKKNVMADEPKATKTEDFVATWKAMETLFFDGYDFGRAWADVCDEIVDTPIEIRIGNMVMKSYWTPATVESIDAVLKVLNDSGYEPYEYNLADDIAVAE